MPTRGASLSMTLLSWGLLILLTSLVLVASTEPYQVLSPDLLTHGDLFTANVQTSASRKGPHSLKLWVSKHVRHIKFIYLISWFDFLEPNSRMFTLQSWRFFISSLGGAIIVQEHVPSNEERIPGKRYGFRSDFRKQNGKLAHDMVAVISQLGSDSGHDELKYAPIIFWGFSREGMHPPSFGEIYPNKLLGGIRYTSHLREDVFDYQGTLHNIPFYMTIGHDDNVGKMNNIEFMRNGRKYGNPWSCLLFHGNHGDGYYDERTTNFQYPWMVDILTQIPHSSLVGKYSLDVPLVRPMGEGHGWLGNMEKIAQQCCAFKGGPDTHKGSLEGNEFIISPEHEFAHNKSSASWFSSEILARIWKQGCENNVKDQPGLIQTLPEPVALLLQEVPTVATEASALQLVRTRLGQDLVVKLDFTGTAVLGVDYEAIPTEVTIPSNAYTTILYVRPKASESTSHTAQVTIAIMPSSSYAPLSSSSVTISIPIKPPAEPMLQASEPTPPVAELTPPVAEPTPPVAEPTPQVVEPTPPVVEPTPKVADLPPTVPENRDSVAGGSQEVLEGVAYGSTFQALHEELTRRTPAEENTTKPPKKSKPPRNHHREPIPEPHPQAPGPVECDDVSWNMFIWVMLLGFVWAAAWNLLFRRLCRK